MSVSSEHSLVWHGRCSAIVRLNAPARIRNVPANGLTTTWREKK